MRATPSADAAIVEAAPTVRHAPTDAYLNYFSPMQRVSLESTLTASALAPLAPTGAAHAERPVLPRLVALADAAGKLVVMDGAGRQQAPAVQLPQPEWI